MNAFCQKGLKGWGGFLECFFYKALKTCPQAFKCFLDTSFRKDFIYLQISYLEENLFITTCIEKHVVINFSMQVVINKFFLLNPEKNFGADVSCRLRKKRKFRNL